MVTTSEVVVDALQKSGATSIFAYPGDPIVDLMERARKNELPVVLARREASAAFMAEATAMATGRLGVCLSTLGPGSTAMLNGVAAANLDRAPVIAISGQIETAREQVVTHQVVDHSLLYSPVTKWAGRIEPQAAATVMRKAVSLAHAERPGAVHLTLSGDQSQQETSDDHFVAPPIAPSASIPIVRRTDQSTDPLDMLKRAQRPIILAGISAARAAATDELVRLAETMQAPVITGPMAKGVFPEDHPYFAGVLDMACNEVLWDLLSSSDLVVSVGYDPVELIKPWNVNVPVLHVDSTPNVDQIYPSACECIGHIGGILDWFSQSWAGEGRWTEEELRKHRRILKDAYYSGQVSGKLNPTDVIDVAQEAFPRNSVATCDVGSHKLLVGQGWEASQPRSVLMSNGLSSMGFGVPAAIAAKIARPEVPVVALVGDGGFAIAATEVRLASSLGLPMVFIVFVDQSLNRIELKQMAAGVPSTATRIEEMDLVKFASSMDCDGARATSREELSRILGGVDTLIRPLIVEAIVDPTQYESQF